MKKFLLRMGAKPLLLFVVATLAMSLAANAQKAVSEEVRKQLQGIYNSSGKNEISLEEFIEINRHVFERKQQNAVSRLNAAGVAANAKIGNCSTPNSLCGNGDFESGTIDATEWSGGFGIHATGQPNPFLLTDGIVGGAITSGAAHQTIVGAGNDPTIGAALPQVAPDGGTYAVRIGNRVTGRGTEYLSKTFVVTADKSIIPFRYALVFQDPGHTPDDQPAFSVRAYDCNMQEIPAVCNLGNGSNIARSDAQDPFFNSEAGGTIAWKDWTQAQIDLSAYIGQTVTIVFTNKDCARSGHWGYTYLDNLCVVCTNGCPYNLTLDAANTTSCGPGKICFNYELPTTGQATGNVNISLAIYQNGAQVGSAMSSGVLTSGTSHCFTIDPSTLGLDASLGAFDYVATGVFSISNFGLSPITVGSPPNGQVAGQNNDYQITALEAKCKNVTVTLVNGAATITAADVDNGSTGCGQFQLSISRSSFTCADIGTNNVVLTVTDATGTATCNATVTVVGEAPSCSIASLPSNNTYTGGNPNNLYLGYGPQSTTLKVTPTGGTSFTYAWSPATGLSSTSSSAPVFTPTAAGTYTFTVTVTNEFGCTTTCTITICVIDIRVPGSNGKKVYVCHVPPGNPANAHTISISINAVPAHIAPAPSGHLGDGLGVCGQGCGTQRSVTSSPQTLPHDDGAANELAVTALPNPSQGEFKLLVQSKDNRPLNISVTNISGRVVYKKSNVVPNSTLSIGGNFQEGTYFVEVQQGKKTRVLRLLKTK